MTPEESIYYPFVKLGTFFRDYTSNKNGLNEKKRLTFENVIETAKQQNGWFTLNNLKYAIAQWGELLTEANLKEWLSAYNLNLEKEAKTVGIVMAGNIPLVGLHDFLCVLLSGNNALIKLSSNDKALVPFIADFLIEENIYFKNRITFTATQLTNFDAVIATGSNNTSRYFEYYFGKYPNIIRKNRNSVAVLTGEETTEQLKNLATDVFQYFGLGCRSVSKIYIPDNYDIDILYKAFEDYKSVLDNHKYNNNYTYNKAVYLMSDFKFFDNGFLLLKEEKSLASPIATLYYEYYSDKKDLLKKVELKKEDIQCIVHNSKSDKYINFGETQQPKLADYADGIDTMQFLANL